MDNKLKFHKYHGTGNDFIVILDDDLKSFKLTERIINKLCTRQFGIGADGLIIINKSREFDFEMLYYNADGKQGTLCGNGSRVAVSYSFQNQLFKSKSTIKFKTPQSKHEGKIISSTQDSCIVSVKMPDTSIPKKIIDIGYFIDTGSPHIVVQQENIETISVYDKGKKLRDHKLFEPNGVNVNFFSQNNDLLLVRTFERGVENETLSCGTGAIASAIAWAYINSLKGELEINIKTLGGNLNVQFTLNRLNVSNIYLKGETKKVFEGFIDLSLFI